MDSDQNTSTIPFDFSFLLPCLTTLSLAEIAILLVASIYLYINLRAKLSTDTFAFGLLRLALLGAPLVILGQGLRYTSDVARWLTSPAGSLESSAAACFLSKYGKIVGIELHTNALLVLAAQRLVSAERIKQGTDAKDRPIVLAATGLGTVVFVAVLSTVVGGLREAVSAPLSLVSCSQPRLSAAEVLPVALLRALLGGAGVLSIRRVGLASRRLLGDFAFRQSQLGLEQRVVLRYNLRLTRLLLPLLAVLNGSFFVCFCLGAGGLLLAEDVVDETAYALLFDLHIALSFVLPMGLFIVAFAQRLSSERLASPISVSFASAPKLVVPRRTSKVRPIQGEGEVRFNRLEALWGLQDAVQPAQADVSHVHVHVSDP